ncbi:GyrI-like domain-containing protein [Pseudoflavitalea rhizosphaerae]|uniref:GyrI-like domain-containing protein n=1 Tax=Pseudoflavitalea rhizosphaerae TaxID=1884793 RepID=UPI000F8EA227|nr:GyrI-like domain-containing protein [Pseudoflavitalea rhizosphaerae]
MEIKTHPPVTVLYSSHQTTLNTLHQYVGTVLQDLLAEAANQKALISGPVYWVYHGSDGKPDTEFTLEIALPVQGMSNSGKFGLKQLPAFKALVHEHVGAWEDLPSVYGQLLKFIDDRKIAINDECREIYVNIDFQDPRNNITTVQMGVL